MSEDSVLYDCGSGPLDAERAEAERLLDGIRWQYYRGAGAQSQTATGTGRREQAEKDFTP